MNEYQTLLTEQHGAVLTIRLNRPKANAMNLHMLGEIKHVLKDAAANDSLRCLVLTGSGKMFSAGQDVSVLAEGIGTFPLRRHIESNYNHIIMQMRELEIPILGAINGPVAGAGLGIALATDIRIAAESARFVFGFTGIGLAADSGVSLILPLMIGLGRAMEMALTNQSLTAQQALDSGLVNRVAPDDAFDETCAQWAAELAEGPTRAMALTKRAFNRAILTDLRQILNYEACLQQIACQTQDHAEGATAFMQKRPAKFSGE
ncbi:MAG TPA: 2-(1,2-epoxy-1,2-dihydrophenyl)acetyl-CoA isomerase [Anaerolineae bacterium]|nr:2-(1,2-epoxy-1,2-dihydrophenyl)acetyl-CoA isomerase [Anaerolineae bacterium]